MTPDNNKEGERLSRDLQIGILGALGSGKSTIAGLLRDDHPGCFVVEERFGRNPYLAKFYKSPARWSFHSQTWFLISKIEQYLTLLGQGTEILDPPLEMDRLYALTQHQMGWMTKAEWDLYERQYGYLIEEKKVTPPDVHIAVTAPEELILERIAQRAKQPGRKAERWILKNYPTYPLKLARNVENWVERNSGRTPVLVIDTGIYDCVTRAGRVQVAGMADSFIKQAIKEKSFLPS